MKDHRKERAEARKKAEKLVSQMTLLEKASQLKYDAAPVKRLGVPAYNYWNEALHGVARAGVATMFPQAIAMAAVFDDEEMKKVGDIIATEGRAKYNAYSAKEDRDIYKGLTFWSPNVNIFRDPRWGRGHETYGEDPYLTSRLGVKFVEGIQGDGPVMKAAACAKHYAVHSGPESLRHEFDAQASMKDMWETYLPAFEALVTEADVEAVMGAYNRTNGEPCCAHKYLMEDVLRGKWKFEGHYTSDCWAIRDFHEHHMVTSTPRQSAAMALNAGCDLNCGNTYLHMMGAYQDGLVTEEKITESAVRLLTTRYLLGLFDGSEYDKIPYSVVECKEHIDEALKMARKSCVLLKNDGVLPIDKSKVNTIGVIGPNADSRAALIGNYHGTSSEYITVLEGIREEAGDDVRILYSQGCDLYKDKVENLAWDQDRISEAVITAENSDVVILCVGLDETLEGEEGDTGNSDASGDKVDLHLPKVQEELIEKVTAVGKPTIPFQKEAPKSLDYGLDFYAPQTTKLPDGRRILIAWMKSWDACVIPDGQKWQGMMTLPRELRYMNGRLYQNPVEELKQYRKNPCCLKDQEISGTVQFDEVRGRMLDLTVEIENGQFDEFCLELAHNMEYTTTYTYNRKKQIMEVDRTCCGVTKDVICRRIWKVTEGKETLKLRFILDRQSIELFVNDGEQVVTTAICTPIEADEIVFSCDRKRRK